MPLDPTDFLELLFSRRFTIPLAIGLAAGIGVYYFGSKSPDAAAVAFGISIVGLVVGVIWHIAGGDKPGSA